MGFLKISLVGTSLFAAGVQALAVGETRTLWFDIPNSISYPQTTPPSFPPSNAALTGLNGSWDSYVDDFLVPRGLSTASAGLRVPNLGQVFSDLLVPSAIWGDLQSVELTVVTYTRTVFTFTNKTEDPQNGLSASVNATLDVYDFQPGPPAVDTDPNFSNNPIISPGDGNIFNVLQSLSVSGVNLPAGNGQQISVADTKLSTNSITFITGQDSFNALSSTNSPSFTALPLLYAPAGISGGTANYSVAFQTFGAVAVGVTYTFVPESDLAWGGLPLVAGGWLIRRRMMAAKKA